MLFKKQAILTYSSRNVMLTSLVLIGAIAFYMWVVAPHRNNLMAAQRYDSVTTDLARKSQIINDTLKIKKKELKELQEELEQTHTRLFGSIEARKFFSNIQTLVEKANCTVNSLKFSPTDPAIRADRPEKNSYLTTQLAKLGVIGSYRNITLLMNRLQDRSEQVRIDAVTIKPTGNNSEQLECNMNITIYVIADKEVYIHD